MGIDIDKTTFEAADFKAFGKRLEQNLESLQALLARPGFGAGPASIGSEMEMYIVDASGYPLYANEEIEEEAKDPQLTLELNRYNLEFNLSPVPARGAAFGALENELRGFLDALHGHARGLDAQVIPIGILPTLQNEHLSLDYMTDRPRYHALNKGLARVRKGGYHIDIAGEDHLSLHGEGVTVEGANTSFQVHLQVPADQFAAHYNSSQLTAPLAMALAANSPLIAGCRLWKESRIALFKQSIDLRDPGHHDWRQPARVSFGQGWLRKTAWELFAGNVALYQPLIPLLFDPVANESVARLPELCLHHGTIWPWNRAVYSHLGGGHMRIEFRYLPAGPTVSDMLANAALCIGWALGLRDSADQYVARLPFRFAEYNFYRAAQDGLDATLIWPRKHSGGLEERPISDLIEEFLPRAREGLDMLDLDKADVDRLWKIIEERFDTGQTGADWQLKSFADYSRSCDINEACRRMLADYVSNVRDGTPVAGWC